MSRPAAKPKGENDTRRPRREFLSLAAGAAVALLAARRASALDYPTRPIKLIIGYAPGGSADVVARVLSERLLERLGQPIVIENRPGAGTTIATEAVVRSPPDGYTLLWTSSAIEINSTLYANLNFDFLRDIAPVASIEFFPLVMAVNPSLPVHTIPEFIAYAKANPGKINFPSGGVGSSQQVAGELFKSMTGTDMVHVPYRGVASAVNDLVAGQMQVGFNPIPTSIIFIRNGQLRALGVTSATRSPALPDVPSISEFVPGYEAVASDGIGVPAGTPPDIIAKLNDAFNAALTDPTIKARLEDLGGEPMPMTPVQFGKFMADNTAKWAKVVRFAHMKVE